MSTHSFYVILLRHNFYLLAFYDITKVKLLACKFVIDKSILSDGQEGVKFQRVLLVLNNIPSGYNSLRC